jgi:hypothetical protein
VKPDVVEYGGDRVHEIPLSRNMPTRPDTAPELLASTLHLIQGDVSGTDGAGFDLLQGVEQSVLADLLARPSRLDEPVGEAGAARAAGFGLRLRMNLRRGMRLTWGVEQPQTPEVLALHSAFKN